MTNITVKMFLKPNLSCNVAHPSLDMPFPILPADAAIVRVWSGRMPSTAILYTLATYKLANEPKNNMEAKCQNLLIYIASFQLT